VQLIAARTAQEYNEREGRHGTFREGRYHATTIEAANIYITVGCAMI
jgi:hypothetical protein